VFERTLTVSLLAPYPLPPLPHLLAKLWYRCGRSLTVPQNHCLKVFTILITPSCEGGGRGRYYNCSPKSLLKTIHYPISPPPAKEAAGGGIITVPQNHCLKLFTIPYHPLLRRRGQGEVYNCSPKSLLKSIHYPYHPLLRRRGQREVL